MNNEANSVKITELGYPGKIYYSTQCLFRRNTLIEGKYDSVVVITIGNRLLHDELVEIGVNIAYQTEVYGAKMANYYNEADSADQRDIEVKSVITIDERDRCRTGSSNFANDMHEAVVAEFVEKVRNAEPTKEAKLREALRLAEDLADQLLWRTVEGSCVRKTTNAVVTALRDLVKEEEADYEQHT